MLPETLQLQDRGAGLGREAASVQFIGTATMLIRAGGFTVLSDPNFVRRGEQIHIGYLMHSRRLTNPGVRFEDLPPVDLVVLSHAHEDHFDKLVRERLARDTPILSTHQGAGVLRRFGFTRTRGLWPWETIEIHKGGQTMRVTALPATHAPGAISALFPTVMGSLLEFPNGFRMYQSGDTLLYEPLLRIPERFPDIDVAVLHLGGARLGPMRITMDGSDGVELARRLNPTSIIPVHFNDYPEMKEPVDVFLNKMQWAGMGDRVRYLYRGNGAEW